MKADLVVVVADGAIEQAIRGILTRPKAVGIRALHRVEFPKLHKMDQGVFADGHEIANLYKDSHEHALLVFDFAWEGRPTEDPAQMASMVEANLRATWREKGRCVVIVPELENWIWSDSPHVSQALGWNNMTELRHWLETQTLWSPQYPKPQDPKLAYERAIREKKVQKSNATFFELAGKVSFQRCTDSSFLLLLGILRDWFPIDSGHEK